MDTPKRTETIKKLAAYLLRYCPLGALREGETENVALCYPRKNWLFEKADAKSVAEGRLLDIPLKDIKAVASSRVLARLVGADRTSFIQRQKGEPQSTKGAIRLTRKAAPEAE